MKIFPITRRVLVEKKINSIKQLKYFIEYQLEDCSIYEYKHSVRGITFWYVKDKLVFLEAQLEKEGGFYLNPILLNGMFIDDESTLILKKYILKELFKIKNYNIIRFSLKEGSDLNFILKNSKKIK